MPIEVELKVQVEPNLEYLKDRLKHLYFEHQGDFREIDFYLDSADYSFASQDKALRVRLSYDLNQENPQKKIDLVFKGPKIDQRSKTREEIGIQIYGENPDDLIKLFHRLGYTEIFQINKNRSHWKNTSGINITVDLIDELDPLCYLEVEKVITDAQSKDKMVNELIEILSDLLQIKKEDLMSERRSYLELVLKKEQNIISGQ